MDDLTNYERRLTLGALWTFRNTVAKDLSAGGDDPVHEIEMIDACDSAAQKLGGDPGEHMYGAPRF